MDKDLVNRITFEIDEKKRVGTMRVDWNGSNAVYVTNGIQQSFYWSLKQPQKLT